MKRKPGRPTKLTPKVAYGLLRVFATTAPRTDACRFVGVDIKTFRRWMRWGRDTPRKVAFGPATGPLGEDGKPLWLYDQPFTYGEFRTRVYEADATGIIRACANLERLAKDDWKANAWKLERLRPEQYGRREIISATATALPGMPPGARVATPKGGYKLTLEVVRPEEQGAHDPEPGSEE